jgi:hypothetical protein
MIILGLVHIDALVLVRFGTTVGLVKKKSGSRAVRISILYGETVRDGGTRFCAWVPAAGI